MSTHSLVKNSWCRQLKYSCTAASTSAPSATGSTLPDTATEGKTGQVLGTKSGKTGVHLGTKSGKSCKPRHSMLCHSGTSGLADRNNKNGVKGQASRKRGVRTKLLKSNSSSTVPSNRRAGDVCRSVVAQTILHQPETWHKQDRSEEKRQVPPERPRCTLPSGCSQEGLW